MHTPSLRIRLGAVLGSALMLLTLSAASADATAPPPGAVGHDVSYPQCTQSLPTSGTFGLVGVTNGIAYSANPCLAKQWGWAAGQVSSPAVYTTPANPAPRSSHYWPTSGSWDPVLCVDAASTTDPGCAYDYGWHAATDARAVALAAAPATATSGWWLDVETANTYNGDGPANAADLQGMIDYLRSTGIPSVGLYSTGYQWGVITGGWTTANDARYRAAWSAEFTPSNALADSPVWVAGLSSLADAQANCGTSFTGGITQLAQYTDGPYDGDLACGAAPAPLPPPGTATVPTAPQTLRAATPTTGSGVALTWSPPVRDGGSPITSYQVLRSQQPAAETAYSSVACTAATCSFTDPHTKPGRRYYYTVTARNSVGTGPPSPEASAVAR